MKLEELMEKYKAGTPGEWRESGSNIVSNELNVVSASIEGDIDVDLFAKVFMDQEDRDLIIVLHNSFPALYNRLRVMEKMNEFLNEKLAKSTFCPVPVSEMCGGAGTNQNACRQCIEKYSKQQALFSLGLTEADIKEAE